MFSHSNQGVSFAKLIVGIWRKYKLSLSYYTFLLIIFYIFLELGPIPSLTEKNFDVESDLLLHLKLILFIWYDNLVLRFY